MQTIKRVKIAFRKLKAHVYFDKTALPLRDKVVEFESQKNFDDELNKIADAYDKVALGKDSPLITEILNSIDILTFPKKMWSAKKDDDEYKNKKDYTVISVGNPEENPIVKEVQHFINMDVRGHILGILWIMAFGKQLDGLCYKNARGNRLRTSLIWKDDDELKDSPSLFEPYFAQYSLWRDEGLTCAEELLAAGHDVLITTLDLKKFYYRTGITKFNFDEILKDVENEKYTAIHKAIFLILEKYTEILRKHSIDCHSGIALPIGFLPSSVLSNWCLSKFDEGILNFWNPAYYGRYVDDIIIVEKIEKGSYIYMQARKEVLLKEDVIDYYLGNGRRENTPCFASKDENIDTPTNITENTKPSQNSSDVFKVSSKFCLSEESLYEFEANKTRIIVLFTDNNSTVLINKFKKELYENVSEFRLMPEVGDTSSQDDFSEFYKLENDATINKLRGVRDIQMDKYELSKFLGRYRVVSSLVDDASIRKFTNIIAKMFNDSELIENYILWERILEIFITDKDYKGLSKFIEKIKMAITILIKSDKSKDIFNIDLVKDSLEAHLTATLNRTLSLVWGEDISKLIESFSDSKIKISLRESYISKRMSNKYIIAMPLEILSCPADKVKANINLTEFSDVFDYLQKNENTDKSDYEFSPYFLQAQDIAFAAFFKLICNNKQKTYAEYIEEIKREINDAPIESTPLSELSASSKIDNLLIKVGKQNKSKLNIAIANVNVSRVYNLENILKGKKPNRKYSRYRALAELINIAIKEREHKADILVLPENYVPIEWLPTMASKAARENIAIITGIEHIIVNKRVYNYTATILPFKYFDKIPTAAIFFQLKKHYAPGEEQLIINYNFKLPEKTENQPRPLYHWNDCYFPVYCCFELASINDRAEFMSWADMVVAVEYNRDTNYFGSIVESLTRDLHCYCVQVNTSEYGDSRISQPTKREIQNLVEVKGGLNQAVLIGEIDIQSLREFQIKKYELSENKKDSKFKPIPPGIDVDIVRKKLAYKNN